MLVREVIGVGLGLVLIGGRGNIGREEREERKCCAACWDVGTRTARVNSIMSSCIFFCSYLTKYRFPVLIELLRRTLGVNNLSVYYTTVHPLGFSGQHSDKLF